MNRRRRNDTTLVVICKAMGCITLIWAWMLVLALITEAVLR